MIRKNACCFNAMRHQWFGRQSQLNKLAESGSCSNAIAASVDGRPKGGRARKGTRGQRLAGVVDCQVSDTMGHGYRYITCSSLAAQCLTGRLQSAMGATWKACSTPCGISGLQGSISQDVLIALPHVLQRLAGNQSVCRTKELLLARSYISPCSTPCGNQ